MAESVALTEEFQRQLDLNAPSPEQSSLYIFGGQNQIGKAIRNVDKLDIGNNIESTWKHLSDLETPLSYFCACEAHGKIYILGGKDRGNKQLSSIYEFSPNELKWTKLRVTLTLPRSEFGVAVIGSKIYSVGGFGPKASKSIEYFDVVTHKVWLFPAELIPARWGHGVATFNNEIYVIGGHWYTTPKVNIGRYHHSVECFNIFSRKWTSFPGMNRRRGYHGVALFEDTHDSFIYAFGGIGGEVGKSRFSRLSCMERFNVSSPDIWTLIKCCMPSPLSNFGIAARSETIYIVGGLQPSLESLEDDATSNRKHKKETVKTVHEYNCRKGEWTLGPPLIFPRRTLCIVSYDSTSTNNPPN